MIRTSTKNFKGYILKIVEIVRIENKEKFLFVSGEFSGIQDLYILVTSKMADEVF